MHVMRFAGALAGLMLVLACTQPASETTTSEPDTAKEPALVDKYTDFTLTTDTSNLSANQKQIIKILIDVADLMDAIYWRQAYGDHDALMAKISDPQLKRFAEINYGPWDRLDGNSPFIEGYGPKSPGANFYPTDVTQAEVESAADEAVRDLYTMVGRNDAGELTATPYHVAFKELTDQAVAKLKEAAALAEEPGLKKYLELRAEALATDDYLASDLAWMDMKDNVIDFVVGPVEVYEDQLLNAKAAHTAYVLVKDRSWSERLSKYAALLPELQRGIPVPDAYKQETPGSDSDLNAYDVIYYAGDCNAGSKTIAINLPNDARVQLQKGTRRLQLKNAMRAKFDKILVPISEVLIEPEQRKHITFDAFFANTMFHEVAHGLGIKNTINGKGLVSDALKEQSSALEEGKADVLGLYMITELLKKGELTADKRDYFTTFIASIFRSVRFGASSAHGRANMLRFNFFEDFGAFVRNPETGYYRVDYDKMEAAMAALSEKILTLQGDGDYDGVVALMQEQGAVKAQLQADLDKLAAARIPTDIVFNQGVEHLDLD